MECFLAGVVGRAAHLRALLLLGGTFVIASCSSQVSSDTTFPPPERGGAAAAGGSKTSDSRVGATGGTGSPDTSHEDQPDSEDGWIHLTKPDGAAPEAAPPATLDGAGIYQSDAGTDVSVASDLCPSPIPTGCIAEVVEAAHGLCNGLDDDCDGTIDDECPCEPGAVQPCFAGPPSRRGIGSCQDGAQRCVRGSGEFGGVWGDCIGGISPATEVCDGTDNDCNGCADEISACVPAGSCPEANDSRVPEGKPFTDYALRGADFFPGTARSWGWTVEGGPCDKLAGAKPSFDLQGSTSQTAILRPRLSGDYTVTLTVVAEDGTVFTCKWIVHVRGPGLRVEMCYPEASTQDLDLFLKRPGSTTPWYTEIDAFAPADDQCDWHNCEAQLRTSETLSRIGARADWGYANSPLAECSGGPQGSQWATLGYCANPRLDIDNNLIQGTGLPENINIDAPREGETFRVMVQNFSGTIAHPIVNIYCGGRRAATYGDAPDQLTDFEGERGSWSVIGAMWRVVDVTTHVSPSGDTSCSVAPLHHAGTSGYWTTINDPTY